MALTRFFYVTCLLLFPLLIIASANDYYTYSSTSNVDKSKLDQGYDADLDNTELEDKSKSKNYTKPDVDKSKQDQGYYKDLEKAGSEDKTKSKSYGYDTKLDVDKSKLDQGYDKDLKKAEDWKDKSKSKSYGYDTKTVIDKKLDQGYDKDLEKAESYYKSKSKSYDYDTKSDVDKPKSENKSADQGYRSKPKLDDKFKSKNYGHDYKPDAEKSKEKREDHGYGTKLGEKEKTFLVGIQGLVLCKSGPKYYPIQGAVARITCSGVDDNGYEKKSVFNCRVTTDDKGYFFAKLSPLGLANSLELTECKAFLEKSSSETCKIPTDLNKRISGALLTSYRILNDNKTKLYSLKPFFFTSEPESTPTGY